MILFLCLFEMQNGQSQSPAWILVLNLLQIMSENCKKRINVFVNNISKT